MCRQLNWRVKLVEVYDNDLLYLHGAGALSLDGRRLSVCPSVCPVPDPKSRTEGHSKLNIGRKEARYG